jgi:hypothetical protein
MASNFFSGVNGRVFSAPIAPILSSDLVVALGTETKTTMLEYVSWSRSLPREGGMVLTAGSPGDAQGNIYPRRLRGGVVKPKVSLEGIYNGDATAGASSDARFTIGAFIVFNLLFHAVGLWGYYGLQGVVTDSTAGTKIGPDPATVKIEIEIDGTFPLPSTS